MASIVVVDDDEQIRRLLRRILQQHDHEVREAPNGQAGIELCRASRPDVVIMDLVMPGKEGLEAIRELRQDDPELRIVAISGGGVGHPQAYLSMAERFGAQRALAKPFGAAEILEAVADVLGDQKASA